MSTKPAPNTSGRDVKAFADHIGELRLRITWVVLAFIVASALAYQFRDVLVSIVLAPIGHQKLVYLTPGGGFNFIFQITMYAGAVVTAPVLIYQLYKFVQTALPLRARRYSVRIVAAATLLMIAGVCFGYFVAVPAALHFLTAFAGQYVQANLTADSYLNFVVAYVAGLGVLFQLPLLLIFWNWISPLSGKKLLSSERFIVLFAFIAAAIITPTPDPTNQAMVAVPIIFIYQLGVIAVLVTNRRRKPTVVRKTVSFSEQITPKPGMAEQATIPRVSVMPGIPDLEPVPVQDIPPVVMPAAPVAVTVQPKPAALPAVRSRVMTIDGIRVVPGRPSRVQPPIQRAEARLITPKRPVAPRGQSGVSIDGVSRAYSS